MTKGVLNGCPFVPERSCKLVGEMLLVPSKDINGIALGLGHREKAEGFEVDREQDQRWINRHRIERAHREPNRAAIPSLRGDDGNPGGKLPERLAEGASIQL